jgi:large subunit ribosomal protein L18
VTVSVKDNVVVVKGPKGELSKPFPKEIGVVADAKVVNVTDLTEVKDASGKVVKPGTAGALHGTIRAIIRNMCEGVATEYTKTLLIEGVGFKAVLKGNVLDLALGILTPSSTSSRPASKVVVTDGTKLRHHRSRPPHGRPGRLFDQALQARRALQGQGCPRRRRIRPPQGGQEDGLISPNRKHSMKLQKKNLLAQKRRWRIRKTVRGTAARPRLALKMTHVHLYAQAIDDDKGVTLVSSPTTSKDLRGQKLKANVAGATAFGAAFGAKAKAAGLTTVVFDRAGRRYHGTVKSFAEAARQAGLTF